MSDIFERASRDRLRIDTPSGQLTVEDLWSVPLRSVRPNSMSLDTIAKDVYSKLKEQNEVSSFVEDTDTTSPVTVKLELTMDILKHIIGIRKVEAAQAADAQRKKELQQRLLQIKVNRDAAKLENLTDEELDKMIADCGK